MKLRHTAVERGNDLYETPAVAVRAILAAEWLPNRIWEPACGPGAIVRELHASGRSVFASDLVDYGCPGQQVEDFFDFGAPPPGVDCIVTNPPFRHAAAFAEHGLRLCPRVVMLLRLAFLESESRRGILEGGQLARVHVFRDRLPMMHRAGWAGPRNGQATAFAWFVWDASHRGPTQMHRLSWRDHADPAPALVAAE